MKVIFAGGGTGGHVMPALAVAQALCDRQDVEIEFVGTKNGMEAQKAPQAGYRFHAVRASQVKGVGVVRGVKGLLTALCGIPEARRLLRSLNPDVVSCVGGYAGFSAGFAASLAGTPLIVQEANAVPGRVNRFLARRADIAALPFEETRQRIHCRRIEVTGNAVRPSLVKRFKILRAQKTGDAFNLFVFGGSQGARRLNEAVMAYAESLESQLGAAMTITHQTGSADFIHVSEFYRSRKMDVNATAFIDDMALAYAEADLVLSRAGGSVAELTALGLPAILVPYPHAADDHQRANAEILRRAGAALMIDDEELTGQSLAKAISDLRTAPEKIESMSRASRDMGRPDAANKIAELILSLGGGA